MKAGLATSVVLHAALLAFGLVTLSAPKPLDAGATEALPVDIVPLSELTQIQEGDKTAEMSDKPAPKPTTRPQTDPNAQKTGDNDTDLDAAPTPEQRPQEVKVASAPPPPPPAPKPPEEAKPEPAPKPPAEAKQPAPKPPEPAPKPVEEAKVDPAPKPPVAEPTPKPEPDPLAEAIEQAKIEPKPQPEKKPEPKPAEVAKPKPAPKPVETAKPEPKKPEPEQKPVETAKAEPAPDAVTLPNSAPSPLARPDRAAPAESKTADASADIKTASTKAEPSKSVEDQVAMLLDKRAPSGGGAKRSQAQKASLGGKQTTGAKLSQGEMDALSSQLASCWNIPAGMESGDGMKVSIRFNLDADGKLNGRPSVDASSGNPVFDQSAVRAVQKCNRDGLTLPKDKADTWSEVVVNFDPSAMF